MKYLKRFNEAVDKDKLIQLKDFCESYLAYLMDDGFKVDVDDAFHDRRVMGIGDRPKGQYQSNEALIRISTTEYKNFTWDSIKDKVLPFLQMVSKQYPIKHNKIAFRNYYNLGYSSAKSEYTLEHLLNGNDVEDNSLQQMELRVRL